MYNVLSNCSENKQTLGLNDGKCGCYINCKYSLYYMSLYKCKTNQSAYDLIITVGIPQPSETASSPMAALLNANLIKSLFFGPMTIVVNAARCVTKQSRLPGKHLK